MNVCGETTEARSVFTHTHSPLFPSSVSRSAVSCRWFGTGGGGALRGDLGLVNTSIINLNRNEPGRLWRCLRIVGSRTDVNLTRSDLHRITQ